MKLHTMISDVLKTAHEQKTSRFPVVRVDERSPMTQNTGTLEEASLRGDIQEDLESYLTPGAQTNFIDVDSNNHAIFDAVKKALEGTDLTAIKSAKDELNQYMQKIGEAMQQPARGAPPPPPEGSQGPAQEPNPEPDIEDGQGRNSRRRKVKESEDMPRPFIR